MTDLQYKTLLSATNDLLKTEIASNIKYFILFGSVAQERDTPSSDIDLLCVMDNNTPVNPAIFRNIATNFHDKYDIEIDLHYMREIDYFCSNKPLCIEVRRSGINVGRELSN